MGEKELLTQLNNLKEIKPNVEWKRASREILLSQISGGYYSAVSDLKVEVEKNNLFSRMKNLFAQPAFVATAIVVILLLSGAVSISAARNTKPGDSLYIAKIISEKARATFTFNNEDKAKLNIEFAGNRAKELSQVLASLSGEKEKAETVGKLAGDIKREIGAVKIRLQGMGIAKKEKTGQGEDANIFSADFGKEENGVQVYDGKANEQSDTTKNEGTTTPSASGSASTMLSTGTSMQSTGASTTPSADVSATLNADSVEKALGEAEKMLENKDYNGTLDQLDKADQIVSQIDNSGSTSGSGTGSDGAATSTK